MEIVIGSEELTITLLSSKSVNRIASHLNQLIPTTYPNENLTRAMLLSDGQPHEEQREVLKIILFLVSNHLIMDDELCSAARYIADAQVFVDVCRYSGLAEPHVLAKIVQVSLHNTTLEAVIDLLYEAAVNTETTNIIAALLEVDRRIDADRPIGHVWRGETLRRWLRFSALQFAILKDSPELANCVLRHGADANYHGSMRSSPLIVAAFVCPDEASAIQRGTFSLIDQLHKGGADFTKSCPSHKFISYYRDPFTKCHPYVPFSCHFLEPFNDVTSLGLATSFSRDQYEYSYLRDFSHEERIYDEEIALQLVKHIIRLAGPTFDLDGKLKSDAMIHAASRGYTKVISFLHGIGARVDTRNGYLCPIYAAVNGAHVETYRQLLKLGGAYLKPNVDPGTKALKLYQPKSLPSTLLLVLGLVVWFVF